MLKTRQKIGKYRIERKLAEGGFAVVYRAMDTIEGVRVALKIPFPHLLSKDTLDSFRHEVRLAARLEHPHILPLKDASFIDGRFVLAYALGERTLGERLAKRISLVQSLSFAEQMLEAGAYAHEQNIIHCDIKPDNMILFPGDWLRLADFGIAKVARNTVRASGSGTVGYIAPEQAMGRPSFRSDVFSFGLILYRMLSGRLPEWPFTWPPPGYERLRSKAHPGLIEIVRRSIEVEPRKRFRDAAQMLEAFRRVKPRSLLFAETGAISRKAPEREIRDWQDVRRRQFLRTYGAVLETNAVCRKCEGPVAESMTTCPWCGVARESIREATRFPAMCPRCGRGLKLDWVYCPWCYGPGFEPQTSRQYTDVRYQARCPGENCTRRSLMPFMRYCPWCHRKVRKKWKIPGVSETCAACGWGVLREFWSYCPWCGKALAGK